MGVRGVAMVTATAGFEGDTASLFSGATLESAAMLLLREFDVARDERPRVAQGPDVRDEDPVRRGRPQEVALQGIYLVSVRQFLVRGFACSPYGASAKDPGLPASNGWGEEC